MVLVAHHPTARKQDWQVLIKVTINSVPVEMEWSRAVYSTVVYIQPEAKERL